MAKLSHMTDRLGPAGAVAAALACPVCFPKLAIVGSALGLGILAPYEAYIAIAIQALFVVASVGQLRAYRAHRNKWLPLLSLASTAALFAGYYLLASAIVLQAALAGLAVATVWQILEVRRCSRCAADTPA